MKHVRLTCINHPHLRWQCKSIAVNAIGQYNGARNIFFLGTVEKADQDIADIGHWMRNAKVGEALTTIGADVAECKCPPSDLRFASQRDANEAATEDAKDDWNPRPFSYWPKQEKAA